MMIWQSTRRRARLALLVAAVMSVAVAAAPALAADCALADHIRSANTNTAVGGCPKGTSHDVIFITENLTLGEPLPPITGTITIEGGGHTISGAGEFRIFHVDGGNLTINNLTMTKGRSDDTGGALILRNHGRATVNDSAFLNNSAVDGGAIHTYWPGTRLTINGTRFVDNRSRWGGGAIQMWGGVVSIRNSSFVENSAGGSGGAIDIGEGDEISVANSTFAGNSARRGGAIGGGHLPITLTHVTMVNNRGSVGKAMYWHENATQVRLRNSIVTGKARGDLCYGRLAENVGNFIKDGSCASAEGGDPLLGEMTGAPARFPLLDFSPAVDAADERFCTSTDQLGAPRPQGEACDIGAIESPTALPARAPVVPPPPCPLALQITAANTDAPAGGCPAGKGHDIITLSEDIDLDAPLPAITSEITIEGNGHTISGSQKFRIFEVDGGALTLKDAKLTKGSATYGGAIRLRNGASVKIQAATFSANDASWGGAISTDGADVDLAVISSSFINNTAGKDAGALFVDGGAVSIANSSFHGNSARLKGGAISGSKGRIEVLNSTISANRAGKGAGIHLSGAETALTHVTVFDNQPRFATGGGIYKEAGKVFLRNSIVFGNTAAEDCLGSLDQSVSNISGDGTCSSGARGNPYLGQLAGAPAHHPPFGDSPAIGAADERYCPDRDQVGRPRQQNGGCDIGAIQASVAGELPTGSAMQILTQTPECGLRDMIVAANTDAPAGGCADGNGVDLIALTSDIMLDAPLPPVTSEIHIRGGGHTISGDNRFRIFDIAGGELTLKNMILAMGSSPGEKGGAIRLRRGALTVADVTFRHNAAAWGGAIAMLNGQFALYSSHFLDNTAENRGGGVWMEGGCEVMADSVFRRNAAELGEREPGPMHDHFGSAIEWGGRAGWGCGDDTFASNVKVYKD